LTVAEPSLPDCPECVERLNYPPEETRRLGPCPVCGRLLGADGPPPGRRPVWVSVVFAGYLGVFGLLLMTPLLAVATGAGPEGFVYVGLVAMVVVGIGVSLLAAPAGRHRRPVGRTSILVPLLGSAVAAGLLVLAGGFAVSEYLDADSAAPAVIAAGLAWAVWLAVFGALARATDPDAVAARLYQALVAGSALELLVAVPLHLVVRRRAECCAGVATGFGIGVGVVVMLLVIGPAVVFLYYRRYRQVYAPPAGPD
jgi:hypothetical protein